MPQPNRTFELTVEDMDLIEAALLDSKRDLVEAQLTGEGDAGQAEQVRNIHELLGRLHNQKQFYRPKTGVYLGG